MLYFLDSLEISRSEKAYNRNILSTKSKESEILFLQNELLKEFNIPMLGTKKQNISRPKSPLNKNIVKGKDANNKSVKLIHVPIERKEDSKYEYNKNMQLTKQVPVKVSELKRDISTETEIKHKDINVGTDPIQLEETKVTETKDINIQKDITPSMCSLHSREVQINLNENITPPFENLHIPNVKLTKEKSFEVTDHKRIDLMSSRSLPNLQIPSLTINKNKDDLKDSDKNNLSNNQAFIISHATVTYTTKQKIDFKVVESKDNCVSSSLSNYPLNVVSVFKKEMKQRQRDLKKSVSDIVPSMIYEQTILNENENNINSFNCSLDHVDSNKLVKPSEIINSMRYGNELFLNDFVSEQFQKELNFIDSFFESLQYLDNCSLSKRPISSANADCYEKWTRSNDISLDATEYNNLVSKLENNFENINYTETQTIASKSLCLVSMTIMVIKIQTIYCFLL